MSEKRHFIIYVPREGYNITIIIFYNNLNKYLAFTLM